MTLQDSLRTNAQDVEHMLDRLLVAGDGPEARVVEAMRYGTLNGGKRIRPFLVVHGAALFNATPTGALRTAAAIEMVHSYSLIHDDLPAMDDDDLRRGRPTTHIRYDEATAILAGDALQALAFEVLARPETHSDPGVRAELVVALAAASGAEGMVGGQMIDLWAEEHDLDIATITRLQRMKTGALIRFSCEAGALLGKAPEAARQSLTAYAHDLGLAFQIADDLLDETGDEAAMGKRAHKDADKGKATFVSLLGVERAREQASLLADQAAAHLDSFGDKAAPLRDLARYVVERRS